MDLFDKEYPNISKLYYDYTQTEEYANHQLVRYTDDESSCIIDKAIVSISNNDENTATDMLTHACSDTEQCGFILGFTYALSLIKETSILKELGNVRTNT